MKLDMVDLHAEVAALRPELDAAIAGVLDSASFVRGPFVERFERELSAFYDGAHVVSVGNGTDALQLAYMAAGIGPGDEVIMPAFTFVATAEAAALVGARPVFVDIEPGTFNLDPEKVEAATTPRTKAIVPVHLFGQAADMDPLLEITERHGLVVIEDAAQSIGATYKGQLTGLMGQFGCLSFYPSKNLGAYGDGGAVVTTDGERAAAVRRLANHGTTRKYFHTEVGVNSRLDALQAAILSVKLPHLAAWTAARREAAARYDAAFGASEALREGLVPPARAPWDGHVFHQYTLRVPGGHRDALAEHLKARDVPTMVYYPHPIHLMPAFAGLGYAEGSLPETERACREVLSLPMHPHLTPAQIAYVLEAVEAFALAHASVPA